MGDYLIIQVKYVLVFNQAGTKDVSRISYTCTVTVSVTLDEDIVGHKNFNLIATINHSSNLAKWPYSSFINSTLSSWFNCNDAAVVPSKEAAALFIYKYILIFFL